MYGVGGTAPGDKEGEGRGLGVGVPWANGEPDTAGDGKGDAAA